MEEFERKGIIDKINKGIEERDSLSAKYEELKKLTENPLVVQYIQLLEDINRIEDDVKSYSDIYGRINDSLDERIQRGFRHSKYSCNHNVWLYAGSYYKYANCEGEEDYARYNSENSDNVLFTFSYNKYVCLECGQSVKISASNWESFENTHTVLKMNERIDIEYYQSFYFYLLYLNHSFSDAQQLVIDKFNQNKENVISRTRKK